MPVVDPARERIAAEVRAEMARQQKKQRDVAAILDLPYQSVQERLHARRAFRAEELAKLAVAFDVPISRFYPDAVSAA